MNSTWRKRLAVWRNRLYLYPPPEPMPRTPLFWLATGLVALLALLFAGYFILYLTGRHNAYMTSAEDLGIMDQAIWNTVHGHILRQTICDVISDTNCHGLSGISRFAIHFEPILFPISLLYLAWPDPRTLLVLQTVVVASGAFPAFWLVRLRLRSELAGVVIAALYLLYPAQQQATVYDFHAVTLTAALLLFTLYFMYTRRTVLLFVFAILSMACKEEIPLAVALFGLWSIVFQQRWRSGLALTLLAVGWFILALFIMHISSPAGQSLLISRYSALGNTPLQIARSILLHPRGILREYVLDPYHMLYLRILLTPAAYLPLLAPWVLVLAVPSLAINLLSSDPNMRSGYFQYNAEIVPILIFATIEAIVLILWVAQWLVTQLQAVPSKQEPAEAMQDEKRAAHGKFLAPAVHVVLLACICGLLMFDVLRADAVHGAMPFSSVNIDGFQGATPLVTTFQWPQTTAHTDLAQRFIDMIPPDASVSAQSHLVPHISQRPYIYLFPYADNSADYIFLDVTGNTYPLLGYAYVQEVKKVLFSGNYGVVAAQDGYLLLKRGLPPPGVSPYSPYKSNSDVGQLVPDLPASFCTFLQDIQQQVPPLQVTFNDPGTASAVSLVGVSMTLPRVYSLHSAGMQFVTYWRVNAPMTIPAEFLALVTDKNGVNHFISNDFPALAWCPTTSWKPGTVFTVVSDSFLMPQIPPGVAHVSLALLPATHPFSTIMDEQAWFRVHIAQAPGSITYANNKHALQLATITVVP